MITAAVFEQVLRVSAHVHSVHSPACRLLPATQQARLSRSDRLAGAAAGTALVTGGMGALGSLVARWLLAGADGRYAMIADAGP